MYHWLITSLLFTGVAGTETQATIPKPFRGAWAASPADCAAARAESKLTLRETAVDLYESHDRVLAIATRGNTELALLGEASGDGQSWLDARQFRLSEDHRTLTDVTGGRKHAVRVRCSSGVGIVSQQGTDSARASRDERLRTLSALASHHLEATPTQVSEYLQTALTDPDAEIRAQGLEVIAGRAGRARFNRSQGVVQDWTRERPIILTFRPLVVQALADGNERVRRAAVVALGNLEYEPGPQQGTGIKLSEELLRELDARYRSDPSELVRAEIVKGVALTSTHSTVRSQLLVDALKDPSTQVIQYALIGIGEGHVAEGLPDCVGLLKHSSRVLRMDAAQAIAANGADATAYINDLRAALSSETDPLVAKTLHGAIDALAQTAK